MLALPGTVAVGCCAVLLGHVELDPARWAGLEAVILVGVVPFAFGGLVIGQLFSGQAAQMAQVTTLLAMSFLGGIWLPIWSLPDAAQSVGRTLPSYHLAELARQVVAGTAVSPDHVVALAGAAALFGGAALMLWRREAIGATA